VARFLRGKGWHHAAENLFTAFCFSSHRAQKRASSGVTKSRHRTQAHTVLGTLLERFLFLVLSRKKIMNKLNPCSDCGQHISDRAPTCPHCGAPRMQGAQPVEPSAQPSFLQSQTAHTAVKGLTAWLLVSWIGKIIFAIAGLAFLAYFFTR
jgi:hypothetical protein